jgi:glycine cleavage system H protein
MKIKNLNFPDDLSYTNEHEWIKIKRDLVRVGITDYAQDSLHEIVFCELPQVGSSKNRKDSLGTVESIKAVSDVYSPISGKVVEINQRLEEEPELLNNSPYEEGWIAVLRPTSLEEDMKELLKVKDYVEIVRNELSE